MQDSEEYLSWLESRRLIISQLGAMDTSIRDLSGKIDKYDETSRDRTSAMAKEAHTNLADLNIRVAMLELRAKLWGASLGLLSGSAATAVVQLMHSMKP